MSQTEQELREALGLALEAVTAVFPGPPPLRILRGDLGWAADALLPVVRAYAEQRAAEVLEMLAFGLVGQDVQDEAVYEEIGTLRAALVRDGERPQTGLSASQGDEQPSVGIPTTPEREAGVTSLTKGEDR